MFRTTVGLSLPTWCSPTTGIALLGILVTATVPFRSLAAQDTVSGIHEATEASPPGLRVFLEGNAACVERVNAELEFARVVDTRDEADIHLRATPRDEAAGGQAYELSLTGVGRFAGRTELFISLGARERDDEVCPDHLLRSLELVLAGFAAATPLAERLHVVFKPAGEVETAPAPPAPSNPPPASIARRPQPNRWAAAIDLGFTSSSGNTEMTSLNTGFRVRHLQTSRFRLEWSSNLRYGESGGEVVARHLQTSLNFDLGPEARLAPFISSSAERDRFRRLDLRSKTGAGVRYGFHKGERGQASLRLAALYSHERFDPRAERASRSDGTWSLILDGNQRLGSNVRVTSTSTFDPVMGDLADYNLEVRSALSTRMTSNLALTLGHNYTYDSTPVADVRPADQRFQAGLTVESEQARPLRHQGLDLELTSDSPWPPREARPAEEWTLVKRRHEIGTSLPCGRPTIRRSCSSADLMSSPEGGSGRWDVRPLVFRWRRPH